MEASLIVSIITVAVVIVGAEFGLHLRIERRLGALESDMTTMKQAMRNIELRLAIVVESDQLLQQKERHLRDRVTEVEKQTDS